MSSNIVEKGFNYLGKKLDSQVHFYNLEEVITKIGHFRIKKIAILVDGGTNIEKLGQLNNTDIVGFFSFSLDSIGKKIKNQIIHPLLPGLTKVNADGWIISAANKYSTYSLNQFLLDTGAENQVIIHHVKAPHGTVYYSYIDFFSNEQKTAVHIHNYFERCYKIPFPLDVRFTLRDCEGRIISTGQKIIPSNGARIISSDDFKLDGFKGYLEIEFEVTDKITPFLHYYANYYSDNFISNNHQSGLGLHPANSRFTRGYIPTASDESLVICLFQRNYSNPVNVKAILEYTQDNTRKIIENKFPQLKKHQMLFQDMKELFAEVDFTKTKAPVVVVQSEVPLHRPNYYYTKKDKRGYYDTSHAGPDPKNYARVFGSAALKKEERAKIHKFSCSEIELKQFILPSEFGIESLLGLGNDTTIQIKKFIFDFYNTEGKLQHSFEEEFDYHQETYLNLNEFLKRKGIANFSGTLSLRASSEAAEVPVIMNGISAYAHTKNPYLTTTAASGSAADNIPFYFRGACPNYLGGDCSVGETDIFGPGICSEEFDTIYAITYSSANKNLSKQIKYEIEVINTEGEKRLFYRSINAHGADFFRLSDLIKETNHNSDRGYYVVWFFVSGAHLYGQRVLIRKKDCAISVEHCYVGKY